jgi:hypothetical protein
MFLGADNQTVFYRGAPDSWWYEAPVPDGLRLGSLYPKAVEGPVNWALTLAGEERDPVVPFVLKP